MKKIIVFFHGKCFDGAVSAALFKNFYMQCIDSFAEFEFVPLFHRKNFSYTADMFEGDEHVVLDFRYPPTGKVQWWFDHHQTTFMIPKDRKHFESRNRKEHFFWNPKAPSNAGFMADTLMRFYNFKMDSSWTEILEWADTIDSAAFESPEIPVELFDNPVAFAVLLEGADEGTLNKFINDLYEFGNFDEMAKTSFWSNKLNSIRQKNWDNVEDIRRVLDIKENVSFVNLFERVQSGYNKFIAYYLEPESEYTVALIRHHEHLKISVGGNPFLPEEKKGNFDIGKLCEKYGGGGHHNVGGIAFAIDDEETARGVSNEILFILRNFERDVHSLKARERIEEIPEFLD
ncbi:MAG: hypothetical protein JXR95_12515 [Deltaproteobacteria bacterium]|nr:hypothetical protein [Deltaproteobacteria bacterium]